VELGALVVTQGRNANPIDTSTWPVLGKTVLDRWVERVQGLGVDMVSIVDRDSPGPSRAHSMFDWVKEGVEQILLILLGSYAEVDLLDVVRFHQQGQHRITRVFDPLGPLGISLLNRHAVLKSYSADNTFAPPEPEHSTRYDFLGYAVRLSSPAAYRKLVEDALEGRCAVKPNGLEAGKNIWTHPASEIDTSVHLGGPCYVGAYATLNPGVVVGSGSSVEHNCAIDIGTTLDHASILPNTYVAPGLCVRNSIIDGTHMESLSHGVSVELGSLGLSARKKPIPSYSSTPSLIRSECLEADVPGIQMPIVSDVAGRASTTQTSAQIETKGQ
jgi:hypothetical protein